MEKYLNQMIRYAKSLEIAKVGFIKEIGFLEYQLLVKKDLLTNCQEQIDDTMDIIDEIKNNSDV